MRIAGAEDDGIFDHDVLPIIYEYTGGIPRKINILCDTALICAFADSAKRVDTVVMREAISELQWKPVSRKTVNQSGYSEGQSDGDAMAASMPRYSMSSSPKFSGGDEQWGRLFSLLLRMMSDMSFRMKNIDEKLLNIESRMSGQSVNTGVSTTGADTGKTASSADEETDPPASHINNVHIARTK